MEFQAVVAQALERAQTAVAEECKQVLLAASELEQKLRRESVEITQQRQHLEDQARQLEREHRLRQEALDTEFKEKVANLDGDRLRLDAEKARLSQGTNSGDVISLNLGGERFVDVKRATLCQCEDSLFGAMFSGRWDGQLDRDQTGRVLLDFNPDILMPLIDHLRARRALQPGMPVPVPVAPAGMEEDFRRMLAYYGMEQFVLKSPSGDAGTQEWSWDTSKSFGFTCISEDKLEAESSIISNSLIFGSVGFASGCHVWAVKLLEGNHIRVGIGTEGTHPSSSSGSTALVYDCNSGCVNGALQIMGLEKLRPPDTIGVRLDITTATVSFFKNGSHLTDAGLQSLTGGPYIPIMELLCGDVSTARLVSTTSLQETSRNLGT